MGQYSNLTSTLNYKVMTDNVLGSDNTVTSYILDFSDSGISKSVKCDRVVGDSIISTTQWGTSTEVTLKISMEDESISGPNIVSDFSDIQSFDGQLGSEVGVYGYTENMDKKFRVAVKWTSGSNSYMKAYYNMLVTDVKQSSVEAPETEIIFTVPLMDIQTGSPNYYEYEGTSPTSALYAMDEHMGWR